MEVSAGKKDHGRGFGETVQLRPASVGSPSPPGASIDSGDEIRPGHTQLRLSGCEEQQQQHQQKNSDIGAHYRLTWVQGLCHQEASDFAPNRVGGSPMGEHRSNKENQCLTARHSTRGKDESQRPLSRTSLLLASKTLRQETTLNSLYKPVLVDYVNCSSGLGSPQPPMLPYTGRPLQRVETLLGLEIKGDKLSYTAYRA
ncbi:immediate early response gene 2 protein-like protein [Lates japonicus]|uniref:Immediate early response gene 2 protein-like protein n=1 Tax=Lates japonicus TaxID=270547 RepID=A0AAD3N8C4_LATJO|nr:immediate early response gene 2 protein-like protein [Lates japonicus]